MSYEFSYFRKEDIESVVELWKALFKDYALSAESLNKYTFLHPDFDPAGCFVAKKNDEVVGFILATVMRILKTDRGELAGFIPVIMVHPEHQKRGLGRALLKKGEDYLRVQGKRKIRIGYPTYLRSTILSLMGVDTKWKEAFWFFRHYGYEIIGIIDSAKAPLKDFQIPDYVLEREEKGAEENIRVGVLTEEDESKFLDFLRTSFPGGWYRQFAYRLPKKQVVLNNVLVLKQAEQIIGFVGPFDIPESGVAALGIGIGLTEEFQGKGLGNIILFRSLEMIKTRGGRECYIFGMGPKRYYEKAGFKLAELWILLEKKLET